MRPFFCIMIPFIEASTSPLTSTLYQRALSSFSSPRRNHAAQAETWILGDRVQTGRKKKRDLPILLLFTDIFSQPCTLSLSLFPWSANPVGLALGLRLVLPTVTRGPATRCLAGSVVDTQIDGWGWGAALAKYCRTTVPVSDPRRTTGLVKDTRRKSGSVSGTRSPTSSSCSNALEAGGFAPVESDSEGFRLPRPRSASARGSEIEL